MNCEIIVGTQKKEEAGCDEKNPMYLNILYFQNLCSEQNFILIAYIDCWVFFHFWIQERHLRQAVMWNQSMHECANISEIQKHT